MKKLSQTTRQIILPVSVLGLCVAAIVWVAQRGPADAPVVPNAPSIAIGSEAEIRAEKDEYYRSEVAPIILTADERNREAAKRCVERLSESFDGYRTGIKPFCEEINTWGTRLGVIRRMPSDWWYEKADVSKFIEIKFAKHLFTDEKLKTDIERALTQFRNDVEANQNGLIVNVRASLSSQDIPGLPEVDYSDFTKDLASRLKAFSSGAAKDSVVHGIVIEIASGVGGTVATQVLAQIVNKLSTMVATSAAAGGGATATGATAGGGGGALGGPLGAAAGFTVGLVVGVVVDWWLSARFEEKMAEQLNKVIDEINSEVIAGNANRTGLREGLRASCDVMQEAYQGSLRTQIVDGGVN